MSLLENILYKINYAELMENNEILHYTRLFTYIKYKNNIGIFKQVIET